MRGVLALAALLLVPGCLPGQEPPSYGLSLGSDAASPVVVTALAVNGQPLRLVPQLIDARSDKEMPRGQGLISIAYPPGDGQNLRLDVEWVELLTRRAYAASAEVPLADLERRETGSVYFAPVFGTGGLMRITSDPVPGSDGAQPFRDLLAVCGTRDPASDRDYAADPGALPGLDVILTYPRPAPGPSACAASGG